jgi:hypothetical protein
VVYGVLRTADALTPFLTTRQATISLVIFCAAYAFIFLFGTFYIYRLIRNGESCSRRRISRLRTGRCRWPTTRQFRNQATSSLENSRVHTLGFALCRQHFALRLRRSLSMVMFWVSLLAISILLYVLLDGVDLGVGLA